MPDTATPSALVRSRSNQAPTVATIGTYEHATPMPTPSPYVMNPSQMELTRDVNTRPAAMATAPTRTTVAGPNLSAIRPVKSPRKK